MQTESDKPVKKRSWLGAVIGVGIVIAVAALLVLNSPRGYDMDLTKIGAGQPALVLVFDPNLVVSSEQIRELDKIRPELEAKQLQLLVADIGRPEAQRLAREHQVRAPGALIFSADGSLVKILRGAVTADELRAEIGLVLDR